MSVCVASLFAGSANAAGIPGVTGDLYLIEKDAANADVKPKIAVKVGDKIEMTWTYPVVPGSIPANVGGQSDGPKIVSVSEVRQIIRPGIVGAEVLGAFYSADSVGTTTIYFNINNGGGKGVRLACDVEVTK
jgi:hypothetical protein